MKLFNTSCIVISLILFTMCISNIFAQDEYINSFDGTDGTDVPMVEEPTNFVPEDNVPNFNGNPPEITDEYGSQTVNRACNFGSGANNRYVSVPSHSDFTSQSGDGSIEMWVYPTDLSHGNMFFSKGNTLATTNFYLAYSTSATVRLFFRIGGPAAGFFYSATALSVNTWSHIAVTWDLAGVNTFNVRFYINGLLVSSTTKAATWFVNNDPVIIGGNPGSSYYTEGLIDEVRFWGSERTTTQIRYNRFVGIGDFGGANTGNALTSSTHYAQLLASWTFNFSSATAYDDIGGHNGTYMGGSGVSTRLAGQPIPYNLALKLPFDANSYVTVPSNGQFNQTGDGTVEAWVYPTGQTTTHMLLCRGTTGFQFFWGIRQSAGNKQVLNIGGSQFVNSAGVAIPINKWTHVAAKWQASGGSFTVTFYVNGVQSGTPITQSTSWNSVSGTLRIGGWHGGSNNNFNGYIDEVRFWGPDLPQEQIKNNMIISGRAILPNSQLVGFWNFDGHLGNWSATTGINGSFSTGGTNNGRLSGYSNETSSGAYSSAFDAHTTTINGTYVDQAYFRGKSGLPIPNPGFVQDTIKVTKWPGNVTTVRALISIQHQYCNNIDIRLYAPNMTYRNISTDNGGSSDNGYLTIFYDGHPQPVTSSTFLSPWSNYVKPEVVMGNFGGSPLNGNWILRVTDDASGNSGTLMGWGLRFNSSVTTVSPISANIPGEYKLHQNYPNPFNPVTNINFDIPKDGLVSIKVFDIIGREISTLVNQSVQAGSYNVEFDASNYSSGTYFYKITSGDFTDVKKMMLVK